MSTSYFSTPSETLDPSLFTGEEMITNVRTWIKSTYYAFMKDHYRLPTDWSHIWVAGSGVSYQWEAAREPGDLDILIGINYVLFRTTNPSYAGLGDDEISRVVTTKLRNELWPETSHAMIEGKPFEVTWYVNPDATDITAINPYAAFDVSKNEWTVHPSGAVATRNSSWDVKTERDSKRAQGIVARYSQALNEMRSATNPAYRTNADRRIQESLMDAADLLEEIHHGRKAAFSRTGEGYSDFGNYRWQAGKESGAVQVLQELAAYRDAQLRDANLRTYGVELPDSRTLIERASIWSD